MERLAHTLGLHEQVVFLGKVADVPQRLAKTQVFVLATHWEGMPLALVEAMAAGCACITSDAPGAREVLQHQHDGLIVAHANPAALAHALEQLLTQPDYAAQLGTQARRTALTRYGDEQMAQRYQALLDMPLLPATKPTP
jgi:glycosyltransferase involved in cell wall biosynthesis